MDQDLLLGALLLVGLLLALKVVGLLRLVARLEAQEEARNSLMRNENEAIQTKEACKDVCSVPDNCYCNKTT